jgi:hypothetical protein
MSMTDLPLFTAARNSDPATSQVNRDAFKKKESQRDMILRTYNDHYLSNLVSFGDASDGAQGLIDEQVGKETAWLNSNMYEYRICYWKRCSELRKLGFIEPTGETRLSSAGQPQQVCKITVEGRRYVSTNL